MNATRTSVVAFLATLLLAPGVGATVLILGSPIIDFKEGANKNLTAPIQAVVQDKKFKFLGGGRHMGWGEEHDGTTLLYQGDTKSLEAFLTGLSRIKGLEVKIRLSRDLAKEMGGGWYRPRIDGATPPVPGWCVSHSKQVTGRLEVRINLAAKDISVERLLEKWLAERASKSD